MVVAPDRLYAFIDETGDRGLSPRSSPYFTFAAVVVRKSKADGVINYQDQLRAALLRQPTAKVKWTDLNHLERIAAVSRLAALPIQVVYVCIPKANLDRKSGLVKSAIFYNYAARLLIERLSWLGRQHATVVDVWFERVKGFDPKILKSYVGLLRSLESEVSWAHIGKVQVDSPSNVAGLATADHAAGAFDAATRRDTATSLVEGAYLATLRSRIYAGTTNQPHTYGFKLLGRPGDLATLPWWPLFA